MATAFDMVVEENEVELSLGLTIGGCFRKSEKSSQIQDKWLSSSYSTIDEKSPDLRSSVSPISTGVVGHGERERQVEDLDSQRRREILALWRQEGQEKREEKQQKKEICRGGNEDYVNGGVPVRTGSMDEEMWLEAQESQSRIRGREAMENEANGSERICKKIKAENDGSGSTGVSDDDQQDTEQSSKQSQDPNPNPAYPSHPFPVVPMRYPFPHLQYVPFANGFTVPYAMPYWAPPPVATVGNEKNVFQPVACRAFRPFQAPNANHNRSASCDSEQNGSGGVKQEQSSFCSNRSLGSSSSAVSDYQSTSHQGGISNDTRSHLSLSQSEQPQLHTSAVNDAQGQSEHSASNHPVESTQEIEETLYTDNVVSPSTSQPSPRNPQEKPISATEPLPIDKPITTTDNPPPPPPHPSIETNGDTDKPPQSPQKPALPQMPCVSTTGDGPNGKTITGFLYRYSKTEVSIMCVCHGSSFTPAEFVKHAGGTEVSHPLRHIVVVPSAFR